MEQNSWATAASHAGHGILLALAIAGSLSDLGASPGSDWKPTKWRGESAWESTSNGWTATVSEERSRLVAITFRGEEENLLHESARDSVSWGGHRGWLGPQSGWKQDWPPPVDWEASFAARVEAAGSVLKLFHPHTDNQFPAVSRTYEWRGGILHCKLNWQGGRHYGIHILQLPRWAVVQVRRHVTPDLPHGYLRLPVYGRPETLTDVPLPDGVSQVEGVDVTLWHANLSEKVAFAPQEILAEIGAYRLKMRRGKQIGFIDAAPDRGLLTQIFLGHWENPFVEIEQLSSYADGGAASTEILVEPLRPGQK